MDNRLNKREVVLGEDNKPVRSEKGSLLGKGGRPKGSPNKTTLFKEAMREGFEETLEQYGIDVFIATAQAAIGFAMYESDEEGNMTDVPILDQYGNQQFEGGDSVCKKIIMDRIAPVVDVEKAGDGKFQININVTGTKPEIEVIEGEAEDV